MKRIAFLLALSLILFSCGGDKKAKETETAETVIEKKVSSICIWDGISIRKAPNKKAKYLTSISLGEKVTSYGVTKRDSANKRNYIKVELSDGTKGWTSDFAIVEDSKVAAVYKEAPIYKRPDVLTITSKKFEIMEMVAVKSTKDGWIEVVGQGKKKSGWIKVDCVTEQAEDVATSILARKKVFNKGNLVLSKVDGFIKECPYKQSIFVNFLQKKLDENNTKNEEQPVITDSEGESEEEV